MPLIDRSNERGRKQPLNTFLMVFATGLVLFGLSLVYGLTGTVLLKEIVPIIAEIGYEPMIVVALAFLVAGFGHKILLCLHLWAPDVYEGSQLQLPPF